MRYLEDFKVGEVIEGGARPIWWEEMLAFAGEVDPQPFHIAEAAARASMYGGIIASGWHSGSLMMRLFYESLSRHPGAVGARGIDELRWLKPVRPGDTLSLRTTVLEVIESRSKPDRGLV